MAVNGDVSSKTMKRESEKFGVRHSKADFMHDLRYA